METSTDVASSLLGKRKVEFSTPEDSSESEGEREVEKSDGEVKKSDEEVEEGDREVEEGDGEVEEGDGEVEEGDGEVEEGDGEVEEGDEDLEDSDDSEWDKDSFDGVEYNSSDHSACSDEEFYEKCRNYNRAVVETKGFFEESDDFPAFLWAGIAPVPDLDGEFRNGITNRESIGMFTCECVDKYNKRNMKNLKFERVLRANFNPGGMTKYYITFAARESVSSDAPLVEYQAKVVRCAGNSYPIFCRPSPPPKKVVESD